MQTKRGGPGEAGHVRERERDLERERERYIYICCKVKTGPRFALLYVKNWSKLFFVLFFFVFFKHLIFLAERKRIFEKKKQAKTTTKKNTFFYKLKLGPIMLRNMLGPVFNLYLDQVFTYVVNVFLFFFVVFLGCNPIFIVFSAKTCKIERNTKKEKDTICEHNCANCSCQNVRLFFFCIFHFSVFSISIFWCFWLISQKSKIPKNQSKQNKKQEQKETKRCKAKTN